VATSIGLNLPVADPYQAGCLWSDNGTLSLSKPLADLNWAAGSYQIKDTSYDFFDLFQKWFTNNDYLQMVDGVGAVFSASVAASTSLLSTVSFFEAIGGATHSGVFDFEVQFEDGGQVDVSCIADCINYDALNSPDPAYRSAHSASEPPYATSITAGVGNFGPWEGGDSIIDGLYSVDKFWTPVWTTIAHPLSGPLTSGSHRVAYSLSPELCLFCMDGGPVFSRKPDSRLNFSLLNEIDLYMWVNGPNARAIYERARFFDFIAEPSLLQRMATP
jgi:hypothetical protein